VESALLRKLVFISKVGDFAARKYKILETIDSMAEKPLFDAPGQWTFNTDWDSRNDIRPYHDTFLPPVMQHSENLMRSLGGEGFQIKNYWFQQYRKGDYHNWHSHPGCMFSSVFYIELPEGTATKFKIYGEEHELDVQEGDIVSFPSALFHASLPNQSNHRKTIISFNLDVAS
jgi:hypothetical protein